jgi:hypothetical protein
MSRDRFEHILQCLHVTNKARFETDKTSQSYDLIGKIRWLLEKLCENFRSHYNPSPYVCVDESMIQYNGHFCSFKQFMPAKPITHGIKLWALACSESKFVLRLEVYLGPTLEPAFSPLTRGRMTQGLDGHFYTLACDNAFTSPELFDDMLKKGIYGIGTVTQKRIGIPDSLDIQNTERRGTLHIRMHRDRQMACVHWSDYKGVRFLSTAADPVVPRTTVRRFSGPKKLEVPTSPMQIMYTKFMRGIDVHDQIRESYTSSIATKKWWQRVFFFCLDTALTNAFIMYRECCQAENNRPKSHADFQLECAYVLMEYEPEKYLPVAPIQRADLHYSAYRSRRRVCRVCGTRSHYVCPTCADTHLCLGECFVSWYSGGARCR